MRPIIIVMLSVQAVIFLATACTILFRKLAPDRARQVWASLAISLAIVATGSWQIADRHAASPGADVLQFGAPFLLGMAIMALLMRIRVQRGLDAAP